MQFSLIFSWQAPRLLLTVLKCIQLAQMRVVCVRVDISSQLHPLAGTVHKVRPLCRSEADEMGAVFVLFL